MGRSIRFKLGALFGFVFVVMGLASVATIVATGSASDGVKMVNGTYLPAARQTGGLRFAAGEFKSDQLGLLLASDAASRAIQSGLLIQHEGEVNDAFDALATLPMTLSERAKFATAREEWNQYVTMTSGVTSAGGADSIAVQVAAIEKGEPATIYDSLDANLNDWTNLITADADAASATAEAQLGLLPPLVAGGAFLVIALGSLLALTLSRSIVRGVNGVKATLTSLSETCVSGLEAGLAAFASNDLTLVIRHDVRPIENCGRDEIGQMAASANVMLARLQATTASYERARVNLGETLGHVHSAALSVSRTAAEVNSAAVQSGAGSRQIAQTISQVASGASSQARASSDTSGAVGDLRIVIEQVRGGAAETARSVQAQAAAVDEMTRSIRSASYASADVQSLGAAVGDAASNGADTVRQTVDGMARIKGAVEGAAVKVTELGSKGHQIGAIVETIDDIAEQTNLLALNAAIEAARAGEQGKGFAVVADEVRKLAERSSRATKEIATLIGEVQQGTEEAVRAMQIGAREVESGAELASRSGAALDEIASAVGSSNAAVNRIVKAMEVMQSSSVGLVSASDAIAAIAQETNAAAESMTDSAQQVASAVESIAGISQQNSASAEEVSAATEQMSAQSEEVVASAGSLADMAVQLETLSGRFLLDAPSRGVGVGFGQPNGLPLGSAESRSRQAA
jgi:methyl-accepting chemotaxis protein